MISEKFFRSKTAIITLFAACFVVLISLGVRQVFGLFFIDFNESLNISNTAFGFAIGIQMLMWGMFAPIFGAMADKIGGNKVTIIAFVFFALGIYLLYSGPNTGIFFQINLGLLIGIGLGGTAISVQIGEVGKHFPNKTRGMAIGIVVEDTYPKDGEFNDFDVELEWPKIRAHNKDVVKVQNILTFLL